MRVVRRGIGVLAVPTAREVNLGTNPVRTGSGGELVVTSGHAIEVQAQVCHCLLGKT